MFTGLSSNLMPTNVKKNGGLIFLIYVPLGSISVLRAFLFRVTSLTLSFDLCLPFTTPRLIRLPLLSVPSTSIVNVLPPYSKPLQIHILTGIFGWLVIGRRKREFKALTLTEKLLLVNIMLFAKKVRLKLFLLCAC